MNLMMLLEMSVSAGGDRIAFKNRSSEISYQSLFNAAGAVANKVRGSSIKQLAILDENSLAVPVALFASAWAGVPFVPINYRLSADEINGLLDRIAPCLLIVDPGRIEDFSGRPDVDVISRDEFLAYTTSGEVATTDWEMDPEAPSVLLFTSGTTGEPKAAILRNRHLVSYILSSVEFMSSSDKEAALVCVPPYHIAGVSAVLSSVYSGRRVVQLPNFDAEEWIELVESESITNAFVVPTMLTRILDSYDERRESDFSSLRAIAYGGGKMPLQVIERAMSLFPNADFTNAYGLTETSSTISVLTPEDHRHARDSSDAAVRQRLVSVGRPLPGVEVEIRSAEGTVLDAEQSGEVYVRGEQVSGEYIGKGSLLDEDRWFPTRDGGYLDTEGFLFLEGRADDVIVRGGENMSPGEIEEVLLAHPCVKDAAVVGVPDEQWGEAVAAALVLHTEMRLEVNEVKAWVRERLRSSKVPQLVRIWDQLPYNETGKLLRRVVRQQLSM